MLLCLLMHFIVIFPDEIQVIGDDKFLINFACRVDFLEEILKDKIFLGVIEGFSSVEKVLHGCGIETGKVPFVLATF